MIYYFTPYSLEKRLFEAFDHYMNLVQDPEAWVCFMDGDIAFLRPDWGVVINEYVKRYPDTGMFTCFASRCHYNIQLLPGANPESESIPYHRRQADRAAEFTGLPVDEIKRRIAGHLMVIKKSTWLLIRDKVEATTREKLVLGVDTKISNAIIERGLTIRLMKKLYVLHYLRMLEGYDHTNHLI